MPIDKPRKKTKRQFALSNKKRLNTVQKIPYATIFEEVETLEELGRRMQELLLTAPQGTRIYLRVRDGETIH